MVVSVEPSWAERARTLVSDSRVARLETLCDGVAPTTTTVAVEDPGDGIPLVWLARDTPAVAGLAARRVAHLTLTSPSAVWALRLVGSFRMEHPRPCGLRAYRPTLLSARVLGPHPVTIPIAAFLGARPDPLHDRAADVLRHLDEAHGPDLLAWARDRGYDVLAVSPVGLDRCGLALSLLGADGVERVRVDPAELDAVLGCACTARPALRSE